MGEAIYGCLIKESSDISLCEVLNPVTLLPTSEGSLSFHSCLETLVHWTKSWEGLLEDPLTNSEEIWYTDGSSFVLDGKRRAGYAVVSNFETIEAKPLPPGTSAQLAHSPDSSFRAVKSHLHWLQVCLSGATIAHAAIWKERGHLTTRGSTIKYGDQILRLLEAIHLPSEVSVTHCKGHQKDSIEGAWGNQLADQAAKRAALQNNGLIGVATLVLQTNLPETPSYTEGETLEAKSEGF